jgi:hypothetical protein
MPIIPDTWEAEMYEASQSKKKKKLREIAFQSISQAWWHAPVIPILQESISRRTAM